jgi:hypothetical protein
MSAPATRWEDVYATQTARITELERENVELREQLTQMRSVINEMADRFGRPEFKTRLFDDFMKMRRDLRRDYSARAEEGQS